MTSLPRTRQALHGATRIGLSVTRPEVAPPRHPDGMRQPPHRRRRMPPVLAARDSIDAGAHIANRFGKLRDLPEHPLFPQIHARLAMGEPPFAVSKWVRATVPLEDPYSPASMPLMTLNSRLRRYSAMLPATSKVPRSYLDSLTKGLLIEINVVGELAQNIYYQKQRISQFAEQERLLPLGRTSEQQRKEVVTLTDMLVRMRDTQIALGLAPGYLSPQIGVSGNTNMLAISEIEFDMPASDPLTRFLEGNPSAISMVMAAIDAAFDQASAVAPAAPDEPAASWRCTGSPQSQGPDEQRPR